MEFPDFRDDDEMAAWFEANDVSAADLEVADDVVVASNATVMLAVEVYRLRSSQNAAPTRVGNRKQDVTPVSA